MGGMDIRTEKRPPPQVWGKKAPQETQAVFFVVEIVLKERDSRGKNNDPVIKDRIKLWLTLCYLGVCVYSAKRSQQGKKAVWSFRNQQQIRVWKDMLSCAAGNLVFSFLYGPFPF